MAWETDEEDVRTVKLIATGNTPMGDTGAKNGEEQYWKEPIGGAVELDETMFGGRRRGKRGWGAEGKMRNARRNPFSLHGKG